MSIIHTKIAKLKVIKIDESQYWDKKIAKKAGKLFGIYIFDTTQTTNCCEITPSYHMRFLYTFSENSISEELEEEIRYEDAKNFPNDIYLHCSFVDTIEAERTYEFEYEGENGGENYEEEFESFLDTLAGNPPVC